MHALTLGNTGYIMFMPVCVTVSVINLVLVAVLCNCKKKDKVNLQDV